MSETTETNIERQQILKMASAVVAAYVAKNPVSADQIPEVISTVFQSLQTLNAHGVQTPEETPIPAVSVRSSVKRDHIVCLEDGRKLKTLKRHLRSNHDMTPDEYRARWGLSADYPMVAPAYAEIRSAMAKKIGLGRKAGERPGKRNRKTS